MTVLTTSAPILGMVQKSPISDHIGIWARIVIGPALERIHGGPLVIRKPHLAQRVFRAVEPGHRHLRPAACVLERDRRFCAVARSARPLRLLASAPDP